MKRRLVDAAWAATSPVVDDEDAVIAPTTARRAERLSSDMTRRHPHTPPVTVTRFLADMLNAVRYAGYAVRL